MIKKKGKNNQVSLRLSTKYRCPVLTLVVIGIIFSLFINISISPHSFALSGSDFKAGRIIDDGIFFNGDSMSANTIQNFLNAKVPACDTWGTQMYGSQTRAQYGAANGNPAPYTCLKDYRQNTPAMAAESGLCNGMSASNRSSAEIIYEVGISCGVNPQVILVLLQKEQSLVTDDWPWPIQYSSATGFGCPDTAPCDPSYAGFFYQVYNAARQFKKYSRDADSYGYRAYRNNSILFNPQSSCGSSNVYIENQATAGLYIYTPYQPNAAALNNLYGTGDSCSSYGNRNFWRLFNDWFGPTTNSSLYYAIIKSDSSSAVYLQTSAGKYYVPSWDILEDWGLSNQDVKVMSQEYVNSLPTRDWVSNLLKDDWGNLFLVNNGKLHYIPSSNYSKLWNFNTSIAVQSLGLVYKLPGSTWVGRFAKDESQPNGQIWLIDKGKKRRVNDANMLYEWGYTPNQLTTISSELLSSMPSDGDVTQFAVSNTSKFLVDMGRKLNLGNADIQNAYYGTNSPSSYDSVTLEMLNSNNGSQFVSSVADGRWYMLENGKKHYITSGSIAELWGKNASNPTTIVSSGFLASIPDGGNLSYLIQTANPNAYWLIDGTKRYIGTSNVANAWIKPGTSPPLYSNQSINHLARGSDATATINGNGSPYTYTMDGGIKRYLTTVNAKDAWIDTVMNTSNQLVSNIPEGSFINYLIKDTGGQAYLLMKRVLYPIDPAFYDVWGVNSSTPTVNSDFTLERYSRGATLKAFIRIGGIDYVMVNGGYKAAIRTFKDAYTPESLNPVSLPADYFPNTSETSYIVKSNNTSDGRMWLVTQGKKMLLTFEQAVSFGYLSKGIEPTSLSQATLSLIPDDTRKSSLLIHKANSGIKLLSFGYALAFPDGNTLLNFTGEANPLLEVSPSIFDHFSLKKNTTRLLIDDRGNYFWMENGFKRYIGSGTILNQYISTGTTYLEGTTMYLIPSGANM